MFVESLEKWHFPYFNDEMGAAVEEGMETAKGFMMGRVLYDEWASYWPNQGDEVPFSSFINNVQKYVVSNTLTEATWNNTKVITGDVAANIQNAKDATDGSISMSGSATLVRWLLANGLLDELTLLVHPIAVGHGHRLFEDGATHPLQLAKHKTFTTGVLNLTYVPTPG